MSPFVESNPLIEIRSGYEESFDAKIPRKIQYGYVQNSHSEAIEALTVAYRSLYDVLEEQMEAPLFPTPTSQAVARHVIENLDEGGYYEGDSEAFCAKEEITHAQFEQIRGRFRHVDPVGIGGMINSRVLITFHKPISSESLRTIQRKYIIQRFIADVVAIRLIGFPMRNV